MFLEVHQKQVPLYLPILYIFSSTTIQGAAEVVGCAMVLDKRPVHGRPTIIKDHVH